MASGYYDANGVYQYGEDDPIALYSNFMNLGQTSVSSQFTNDRARLATLEATAAQPNQPNYIQNGAFDIWQRGITGLTNFAGTGSNADRWGSFRDGTGSTAAISAQLFTPGTELSDLGAQYYMQYSHTVAGSGGTQNLHYQRIEDVRTLSGTTVTLSFYAKADTTRTVSTSFVQNFGSGGSAQVTTTGASHNLTTGWQRFSVSVSVPAITGKTVGAGSSLRIVFGLPVNTTQTIDIWGVQLEKGTIPTPFRRQANSVAGELLACQRYYYRSGSSTVRAPHGLGAAISSTSAIIHTNFPNPMRIAPTVIEFANLSLTNYTTFTLAVSAAAITDASNLQAKLTCTSSGMTAGFAALNNNNNLAGYLGFSAEL